MQVENEADYCECSFWSNRAVRNEGNVILQKVKEVTTVRARWMVTFVEDLLPFEGFLNKTQNTTVVALRAVLKYQAILAHYNPEKKKLDINGIRCK